MGGRQASGGNSKAKKVGFPSESLDRHYEWHAKEYPGLSKNQYNNYAKKLRDKKLSKTIDEFWSDSRNSYYKYDNNNNDLVIYRKNGEIVTLFKPTAKDRYFENQRRMHG